MDRLKSFLKTTLLGGVTVILPVAILAVFFHWLFQLVTGIIEPLTRVLLRKTDLSQWIANLVVLAIILGVCFAIGIVVKTRIGQWLHRLVEERFFRIAPGYNLIKETVAQLFGGKKAPFSSVALAKLFGNDALATVFITDEHDDGSYTVFVPTGPNPTSGFVYHLPAKAVFPIDVSIEDAMRSVISCGGGSAKLIEAYRNRGKS